MPENSERESVRHQRQYADMPGSQAYTFKDTGRFAFLII